MLRLCKMTTLNLNIQLPDDLAREAERRGLLSSEGIEAMVRELRL